MLFLILWFAGVAAPSVSLAQSAEVSFEAEALTLLSNRPAQPRLEVFVRVPYPSMRFVRRGDAFEGGYTVRGDLHRAGRGDRPTGLVASRTWDVDVELASYDMTQAFGEVARSSQRFDVPAGRYVLQLRVEDAVSGRSTVREQVVDVVEVGGRVAMSDLIITERSERRSDRLVPVVGGAVSSDDADFTLYYELMAPVGERLRARYTVYELGPEPRRGIVRGLLGRRDRERTPVLQTADWLSGDGFRATVTRAFPLDRFNVGEYEIEVQLEGADGRVVAERSRPLHVRWTGLIEQLQDLDVAIAQLRYIAKPQEIRAMRDARTLQERVRLFQEFWDRRDPSPGSARNERMEEYYSRVAFANRHYGRLDGTGWQTDQGEVFVRFGEPDRVESRSATGTQRPHQVWVYERIGRRFIFVDEAGSGDYRLLVPIWDERTRL